LLWSDASDETALDNLRVCIWSLRKALGDTEHRIIAREGEDIVLDAHAFEVDVLTFRRLAAQSGRPELEEAAQLYVGELLEGLNLESDEFESWRRGEAARFQDQAIDVLSRLMMQLSEAGETDRAIDIGTRILRLEPLHEAAVRSLMRLYGESGRRGTAVQLYRTLAERLKKELGAEPEAETRALFADVSRGGNERTPRSGAADARTPPRSASLDSVSSPRTLSPPAQRAGDDGLVRRADTRPLDGVTAKAHDKWRAVARSKWSLAGGLFAAMMAAF